MCCFHLSQRSEKLSETARGGLTAGSACLLLNFLPKERWHGATLEKHAMCCKGSVIPFLFWETQCIYFPTLFNACTQIVSCQGSLPWDSQENHGEIDDLNGHSGVGKIKALSYWIWSAVLMTTKPSKWHRRNEIKQLHGNKGSSDIKVHMLIGGFLSCWLNPTKNQQVLLK